MLNLNAQQLKKLIIAVILFYGFPAFSQKLVINEFGFKLTEEERASLEILSKYETKIYNGLFNTFDNDSLLITVNLYKKAKEYKAVSKEVTGNVVPANGFFSGKSKEIYVLVHANFMETVLHEMSHSLLHRNIDNPPKWIDEGLAEFFRSLSVVNRKIQVNILSYHKSYLKQIIDENRLNLSEYLLTNYKEWYKKDNRHMYSMAYTMVHYIIIRNPDKMTEILSLIKKRFGSKAAMEKIYGSVEQFEKGYRSYYK